MERLARKFTRTNDSRALVASLGNFLRSNFSPRRQFGAGGAPTGKVEEIALRAPKKPKTGESEMNDFASLVVSHWNPYERRIADFAESFVFNMLIAISFRRFRELRVSDPKQVDRMCKSRTQRPVRVAPDLRSELDFASPDSGHL